MKLTPKLSRLAAALAAAVFIGLATPVATLWRRPRARDD